MRYSYRLVANSWSASWGDHGKFILPLLFVNNALFSIGFFKILRGYNNCGIESEGYGAIPRY